MYVRYFNFLTRLPIIFLLILTSLAAKQEAYRDYEQTERACVQELYRLNHINQTVDFVLQKKREYRSLSKARLGMWEVLEQLNKLVDESDPDLDLPQIVHALQTAEAIRKDGHPRWLILTGLIHDCGKMLLYFGEPQWAVVGDTFPVGCAFSNKIVHADLFAGNPDINNPTYQTLTGIYVPHCGLNNVHMSWGHDEYLYQVIKNYLPEQAAYIIRYHSFYAFHKENEYTHLLNEYDRTMLKWVKLFNTYDLYSKCPEQPDIKALKPYYQKLISEFFPDKIAW